MSAPRTRPRMRAGALALLAAIAACNDEPPAAPADLAPGEPPRDLTAARGGDAMPAGAIAFFKTPLCPNGWFPYGPAAGRFIVPTVGAAGVGDKQGTPLESGEDRHHEHAVAAKLEPRSISFAGIAGESNHGVAGAGAVTIAGTADAASAGLPYLQLLVCQKGAAARPSPGRRPLPRGALAFFAQDACPEGWTQAGATQGRMLVGLPERGALDATFGGPPLASLERRGHTHAGTSALSLPFHGVALVSGCCAPGYAASGDYKVAATAESVAATTPYVQLLQCQKL